MNTRMKLTYKAVSRKGLGLAILASLSTTVRAEVINNNATVNDLPESPLALYIGQGGDGLSDYLWR